MELKVLCCHAPDGSLSGKEPGELQLCFLYLFPKIHVVISQFCLLTSHIFCFCNVSTNFI